MRVAHWILMLSSLALVGSCSDFGYYWQAMNGQLEILQKRRPIETVLEDPAVPEAAKSRIRLAMHVQAFAISDLDLPAKGSYRYYADLGRPFVSWLVVAAPPLEMTEHTWCYPIVGCLGYRGYFHKEDALKLADGMRKQGFDVLVRAVRAYSTLGWFDDPLLNTFVQQDELDLMATLIHEQAHRRVWVNGDTDFNESFAGFVEQEGLKRYLESKEERAKGGPELMARYRAYKADRDRFQEIALAARRKLADLYASSLSDPEKLARKAVYLDEIRQDYQKQRSSFKLLDYDEWFGPRLNNAYLAGITQYQMRIDAFAELFKEQGNDFGRFYVATEALGKLSPADREAALDRLSASFAASSASSVPRIAAGKGHHVAR